MSSFDYEEGTTAMYNFFTPIDPGAKRSYREAYREYLIERDGELDAQNRTLSRREEQMKRFELIEPMYDLDRELFESQYTNFDKTRPITGEMALLLALCKLNAAEAYGVQRTFPMAEALARKDPANDIEVRVLVEECYHTRILQSSAREYGITITSSFRPPVTLRGLIGTITSFPLEFVRPLVLASEVIGTLLFAQMFCVAGKVLSDKPVLRDRIQERIAEILIDEIGHMTLNQLELGAWGMFQARRMVTMTALGMRNLTPEWALLGVNSTGDMRWLAKVPREVTQRAFVAS